METEWVHARIELYQLIQTHPEWTNAHLAEALGRSLSWVKKWKKRFRETARHSIAMFLSCSCAPKQPVHKIHEQVRKTILALRDGLGQVYHRVSGPKLILYHLHRDEALKRQGHHLPTSPPTIWKVLKEGGRILERIHVHHPIERPDPMVEWEFDFGMSNSLVPDGNVLPYEAFPSLPMLPTLPDQVDADAWLNAYQGRVFRRYVSKGGSVMVGKDHYYIGKAWCGQRIALHLDAHHQQFQVQHNGKLIKNST